MEGVETGEAGTTVNATVSRIGYVFHVKAVEKGRAVEIEKGPWSSTTTCSTLVVTIMPNELASVGSTAII